MVGGFYRLIFKLRYTVIKIIIIFCYLIGVFNWCWFTIGEWIIKTPNSYF